MTRLSPAPTVDDDWGAERRPLEDTLNKFGKCCLADKIPDATLETNYLSVGFPDGAPDACEFIIIVLVNGSVYWSFDAGTTWLNIYLSSTSAQTSFATGTIVSYGGDVGGIPATWLSCDGSEVDRTTYSDLFAIIDEIYGNGDGSTTFNLPDMRGQSPAGGNYATLPNSNNGSFTTRDLNDSYGTEDHQLTTSELPAHVHTHNRGANANVNTGGTQVALPGPVANGATGSDTAHVNMNPSGVAHFVIKI